MIGFHKALFVLDSNFASETQAIQKAAAYARTNQAQLDFICVLPDFAPLHYSNSSETINDISRTMIEVTTTRIHEFLSAFESQLEYNLTVVSGKAYVEIIRLVLKHHYDLVIKQSEDPSWLQSIFGSNDLHLLRKCPCAVWLIHEACTEAYTSIVAAIDFSDDDIESELNLRIAYCAAAFSITHKAPMHVISAYDASVAGFASLWANNPNKFEKAFLDEEERRRSFSASYLIKQVKQAFPASDNNALTVKQHIVQGNPAATIPAKVHELKADLVVMGTVGRSGVKGMLIGNTAESVLLQLKCSVLALKPKNFLCPILIRH
jgi:nucleotide-binding universal stress UspA family protein